MITYSTSKIRLNLTRCTALAVAACVAGCGTPPKASMGDVSVYTPVHLQAAALSDATGSGGAPQGVGEDLKRFYRTKTTEYDSRKFRMDDKLDSVQRSASFMQAMVVSLAVDMKLALKGTGSSSTGTTPPSGGAAGGATGGTASGTSGGTSGGAGNVSLGSGTLVLGASPILLSGGTLALNGGSMTTPTGTLLAGATMNTGTASFMLGDSKMNVSGSILNTATGTLQIQSGTLTISNGIFSANSGQLAIGTGNYTAATPSATGSISVNGGTYSSNGGGVVNIGANSQLIINSGTYSSAGTNIAIGPSNFVTGAGTVSTNAAVVSVAAGTFSTPLAPAMASGTISIVSGSLVVPNGSLLAGGGQLNINGGAAAVAGSAQTAPSSPPAANPLDALRQDLKTFASSAVTDSPFDELDRVSDFYTAYQLKLLRMTSDARTAPTDLLGKKLWPDADVSAATTDHSRLLFLYFQTHIDPGTRPNQMVGVQMTITGATLTGPTPTPSDEWIGCNSPDLVKVVRIHPTRNYDLENVSFAESLSQSIDLAGAITAPESFGNLSVSGKRSSSVASEQLRRFMSRIGKAASYADAPNHVFGWNFFPSNLSVVQTSALESLMQFLVLGGTPTYKLQANLDGGAHDCLIEIVVPSNLKSFDCKLAHYYAYIDPNTGASGERSFTNDTQVLTIILPPVSKYETLGLEKKAPLILNRNDDQEGILNSMQFIQRP